MTSITTERTKLANLGASLRLRSQWGAVRSYTDARAVSEPASHVFVHITVTNPSAYNSNDAHARAVEAIGISRFPNTGISYNRGVMMNGLRYEFQPIGRRGAHTGAFTGVCTSSGCPNRGRNVSSSNWNVAGRGYVICQNVGDAVSAHQLDQLARTIAADQLAGFVVKGAIIHGHRCVSDKSCPGDKMWALMGALNTKVAHYVSAGLGTSEEDLVTTQAEFNTFMTNWVNLAADSAADYDAAVNKAVLTGTATPAVTSIARAGKMLGVLPWWQVLGRHDVEGKTLAPNMHGVMSEVHQLYGMFAEEGELNTELEQILTAASEDPNMPDFTPEQIAALAEAQAAAIAQKLQAQITQTTVIGSSTDEPPV